MKQYLKKYQVVIRTAGPVFIGSGREIGKKEYIFLEKGKVGIADMQLLYQQMKKRHKENELEEYLLSNDRMNLTDWLKRQNALDQNIRKTVKYELDCGDALLEKGKGIQVLECVKDAYGKPYIPGSSLKGMFRTILLCEDIIVNPSKYVEYGKELEKLSLQNNQDRRINRTSFLKKEINDIEAVAYRTLGRGEPKDAKSAVNDIMQGFIVSDSEPLSADDLVLCQSVMLHTNEKKETRLPILRECIKPDTEIRFTVTVDTSVCQLDSKAIIDAVKTMIENYYKSFQNSFSGIPKLTTNSMFLGGGSGFVSKTIIYSMFPKEKGVAVTANIFDKTGVPKIHKHYKDISLEVSPHTLKCTYYQKKLHQMGLCKLVKFSAV